MDILSLFVVIPVLTITAILLLKDTRQVRLVSAFGMGLQLLMAAVLVYLYLSARHAGNLDEMLFVKDHLWFKSLNIHYCVGVDGISVAMICLTSLVVFAGIFASWEVEILTKEFFVTLMLMGGSALLLVGLLGIYFNSSPDKNQLTFNILEISKVVIPLSAQRLFFPLTFVGFGVLGALFPFHTWSPDGHASAPTAVSMLHAGVLMKLGGYGAFRVAIFLMPEAAHELSWIFIILTSISVVYGAFGAIAQKDLKYINAYSSVSHCGLVLFAVLMMNQTAMNGAIIQMISHGLMTALFFALIGMIYGRTHTRIIQEMGGLMKVIPFLGVVYVIAGLASLGP